MADFTKFRSSINGFNRSDVTDYIESISAEHQKALAEATALKQQLAEAKDALAAQTARADALQMQLDETETALSSTEAALDEALAMVTEAQDVQAPQELADEPAAEEETAEPEPTEVSPDYIALELEAYRRAEAMERNSAERSTRVRQQLNNLLDQVSARYEQTGTEIQALTDDIRTNLIRLQESLADLDAIFDETTQNFDTMDADAMNPEAE